MDAKSILNKDFPACANEALLLIRSNYNRIGRQELTHLAYQYIFFNEYKQDQNIWVKKTNSMQELQCVDCIVNYLENEKETNIRDFIFDLLFSDIYHQLTSTKFILQLLFSYAISLQAQKTLECASKWIITNIGNEIIQNIFEHLVKDHFILIYAPETTSLQSSLINLCQIAPLFASLFMSIILDMLANDLIRNQEKFLNKMFYLFEIWINKNSMLPLLAYKSNLSHFSSYMLNPVPGLIYITVIYPVKNYLENAKIYKNLNLFTNKLEQVDQLVFKVNLISLKLIKDLFNSSTSTSASTTTSTTSTSTKNIDLFKLLNLKNFESISKRLDDYLSQSEHLEVSVKQKFNEILNESMERLAQLLELCWQYGFISCTKLEIKTMFIKLINLNNININNNEKNVSLMEIVLST